MSQFANGVALSSTAATATRTSDPIELLDGRGVQIILDVTATPNNAETLTLSVGAFDGASNKWQTITAFTALTASGIGATSTTATYIYTLYPGGAETAATNNHEVQALPCPRRFRVVGTQSSSGSWTYSVGYRELA